MLLFEMLQRRVYLFLSIVFSSLIIFLYPFFQVLPQGLNNFWFWFSLLTPLTWTLYLVYGVAFGLTASFFIFRWRQKVCLTSKRFGSGAVGSIGAFLGLILPQCSACFSLALVFLPLSFVSFFSRYLAEMMLVSVGLLLLSLWVLGAFGKVK